MWDIFHDENKMNELPVSGEGQHHQFTYLFKHQKFHNLTKVLTIIFNIDAFTKSFSVLSPQFSAAIKQLQAFQHKSPEVAWRNKVAIPKSLHTLLHFFDEWFLSQNLCGTYKCVFVMIEELIRRNACISQYLTISTSVFSSCEYCGESVISSNFDSLYLDRNEKAGISFNSSSSVRNLEECKKCKIFEVVRDIRIVNCSDSLIIFTRGFQDTVNCKSLGDVDAFLCLQKFNMHPTVLCFSAKGKNGGGGAAAAISFVLVRHGQMVDKWAILDFTGDSKGTTELVEFEDISKDLQETLFAGQNILRMIVLQKRFDLTMLYMLHHDNMTPKEPEEKKVIKSAVSSVLKSAEYQRYQRHRRLLSNSRMAHLRKMTLSDIFQITPFLEELRNTPSTFNSLISTNHNENNSSSSSTNNSTQFYAKVSSEPIREVEKYPVEESVMKKENGLFGVVGKKRRLTTDDRIDMKLKLIKEGLCKGSEDGMI